MLEKMSTKKNPQGNKCKKMKDVRVYQLPSKKFMAHNGDTDRATKLGIRWIVSGIRVKIGHFQPISILFYFCQIHLYFFL